MSLSMPCPDAQKVLEILHEHTDMCLDNQAIVLPRLLPEPSFEPLNLLTS